MAFCFLAIASSHFLFGVMLCEIAQDFGFVAVWMAMTVLGLVTMGILSGLVFIPLYSRPKFDTWKFKCNPSFPSPALVKKEIVHTCKGLVVATLIPAYSLKASWTQSYCGNPYGMGPGGFALQALVIIAFTDLVEYGYHWMGHKFSTLWEIHKHHHAFYNPSPFAVIADDWPDQFCRTLPMIMLPAMVPINIDLLFGIFTTLFYGYGVYLHSGYESPLLSAHNPIFNTSYHHYHHHAISIKGKPVFTGFFIKLWDWMFGSVPPASAACGCCECRPPIDRSEAVWKKTVKPDYSVLLSTSFWATTSLDVKD
jgi:lathosterol oxidase